MNPIEHPVCLSGSGINLIPLEPAHFDELIRLAADPRIWEFYIVNGTDPLRMRQVFEEALVLREQKNQYPFVIQDAETGALLGSTRLMEINTRHRKLEIGWTWLHPDYWHNGTNTRCKFLLLQYCFESLGVIRVQLKTHELNQRSRRAIEKTGAQFEGILRNDMIREDGRIRHSAYYSILDSEWPQIKSNQFNSYR